MREKKTKPTPLLHFPSKTEHFLLCNEKAFHVEKNESRFALRRNERASQRRRLSAGVLPGAPRAPQGSVCQAPGCPFSGRGRWLSVTRGRGIESPGNPEGGQPPLRPGDGGSRSLFGDSLCNSVRGNPQRSRDSSESRARRMARPAAEEVGPGRARGAGRGEAGRARGCWRASRGRVRGGRGVASPPPGRDLHECVRLPQTSCFFYAAGTRGPGRAGGR